MHDTMQELRRLVPETATEPLVHAVVKHIKQRELHIRNLEEFVEKEARYRAVYLILRELLRTRSDAEIVEAVNLLCYRWEEFKTRYLQ